jgi:hypothetical protein
LVAADILGGAEAVVDAELDESEGISAGLLANVSVKTKTGISDQFSYMNWAVLFNAVCCKMSMMGMATSMNMWGMWNKG